tara:strand:- start:706 stop:1563 length:858 start_codon:yes stop_codon:yes gene_type:complete
MKKFLSKILFIAVVSGYLCKSDNLKALIPYYYFPSTTNLEKESLSIGKTAYQLLYFGQIKDSLNLAKIAVKINSSDEKLWLILADAQIANKLFEDAQISLSMAEKINPKMSEIFFAQSSIFLKQSQIKEAKEALIKALKIQPKNHQGMFQLGNIFLIENNYENAIKQFDKAIKVKTDFWQAINNKGLAYYELDKISLSITAFKKAIEIEENAEPLLGLASCLKIQDLNKSILLAKKALLKNPNYVSYQYRKEQLWGEKLQNSTKELLKNKELKQDIILAKTKILK